MNLVTRFAEENIAHILRSEIVPLCLIEPAVLEDSRFFVIDDKINKQSACQKWRYYLLSCIFSRVNYLSSRQINTVENPVILDTRTGYVFNEFIDIPPSRQLMSFTDFLKDKTGTYEPENGYVLLVQRPPGRRSLTEASSGLPLEEYLAEALGKRGIPFKHCDFGTVSPHEQVEICRGASVMVGAHGAGLSNMIFTPRHCSVLEYNFRKYWYCDPVCDQHFSGALAYDEKCDSALTANRGFHKADFRNLSLLLDRTYKELDVVGFEGYHARNPIGRNFMIVDGQQLVVEIEKHLDLSRARQSDGYISGRRSEAEPYVGNPINEAMSKRTLRKMKLRNVGRYLKSKVLMKKRV